jgi:hypothetical protein
MTVRISLTQAIAVAIAAAALPLVSINAAAQIAVSSNDGKVVLVNGVSTVREKPIDDTRHDHKSGCFTTKDHCRAERAIECGGAAAKRGHCL